jgi:hypothetical protein
MTRTDRNSSCLASERQPATATHKAVRVSVEDQQKHVGDPGAEREQQRGPDDRALPSVCGRL